MFDLKKLKVGAATIGMGADCFNSCASPSTNSSCIGYSRTEPL